MDNSQTTFWQPTSPRICVGRMPRRAGFSLVELVMVLLIIGILAATAIPKYGTALTAVQARGAANWIKSDLQYAQRLAQQTSSNQSVTFDIAAESYTLPDVINIDRRDQSYGVALSDSEFQADLETVDFAGNNTVTFDIHGRPDNPGTIVVRSGNTTETIEVNAAGQVTIQ